MAQLPPDRVWELDWDRDQSLPAAWGFGNSRAASRALGTLRSGNSAPRELLPAPWAGEGEAGGLNRGGGVQLSPEGGSLV